MAVYELNDSKLEAMAKVRILHAAMSKLISSLLVDSRERELALVSIEQAEMWTCRSIERHGAEHNLKECADAMLAEVENGEIAEGIPFQRIEKPRNYEHMLANVYDTLTELMRAVSVSYHSGDGE